MVVVTNPPPGVLNQDLCRRLENALPSGCVDVSLVSVRGKRLTHYIPLTSRNSEYLQKKIDSPPLFTFPAVEHDRRLEKGQFQSRQEGENVLDIAARAWIATECITMCVFYV